MATMEQWKDRAAEAAQDAAKAAKYVALVSKKKLAIASEQEKIRRAYTRLGKVYYKDYVTDEEPDSAEYEPICDEISDCYRKINALKEELTAAKAAYNGESAPDPDTAEDEEETETAEPLPAAPETEQI